MADEQLAALHSLLANFWTAKFGTDLPDEAGQEY